MISNLGMGFDPQRASSTVIQTDDEYAKAFAQQMAQYRQQIQGMNEARADELSRVGTDPATALASQSNIGDYWNNALGNIQQQQAATQAQYDADAQQRHASQASNQQAYNIANGGGFAGGILNSSYANPFGNTVTGLANPAAGANMASSFTSGLMGGFGPTAAPSTGIAPFGAPAASQGQQWGQPADSSSWGGPFSNKNPWSLG